MQKEPENLPYGTPDSGKRPANAQHLPRDFFERDAVTVARALIGTTLVRHYRDHDYRVRVVETEAYIGPHDLASHAAKGRTARTETMYLPGGHVYVYFIYGMYHMLNIVTGHEGDPQAVLLRAAEPVDGWPALPLPDLSGPGKLCRALHITRAQNGLDATGDALHFLANAGAAPQLISTPRIGVDYAGEWKNALLRFLDVGSSAVSKAPRPKNP